jgi:hypothetical protein
LLTSERETLVIDHPAAIRRQGRHDIRVFVIIPILKADAEPVNLG